MSNPAGLEVPSFKEAWDVFFYAARKYKQDYKKIPVLIIDNANKLVQKELEDIQDLAKSASDKGIATIVFVSSGGHVPRRMMGKLLL